MILGPLTRHPHQPLSDGTSSECVFIERIHHFKLFGIKISHGMNWQIHIDAITHKAASRLHFLRILKKPGLKSHHLLHFSERELTFTFAICYRLSVCRLVCLSVVCLSVTLVRPTQAVQIFGNISTALHTLSIR